jgi:hypothetical protein
MKTSLLLSAIVLLLLPAAADSRALSALAAFHTPGKAVECFIPASHEATAPSLLVCWKPNDGFRVSMTPSGRVTKKYDRASRGYHDYFSGLNLLRFNNDWSWAFNNRGIGRFEFLCQSRSTGLTCKNRTGHGWWLGRQEGYRIF